MDIEIPGYQLLRTIGKGGMATVFLAKQNVLERKVALKIMSKALAEEKAFGERFMREARIVSQLVHPNIVTVHEVGQHEGRYFLSMEYIDGHDLRTVGRKLDILGKIRVIEDIARALHYAGDKGYVHRDIKPENIMFRSSDGSAVLTDFGIAKAVKTDLSMTQTGTAIGTPHYMSPEQAKGKPVDHRSDLYSLGIVFYQLLTGKVPYDAETAIAIGIKHITEPVPTLALEYKSLQPILDGLLAKSVENRYQSGLALLNDLRTIDLAELRDIESSKSEMKSDAEALTVLTGVEFLEEEAQHTDRFTIEFNASETIERAPAAIWSTMVASFFVVSVVILFVYLARPEVLEPWISKAEHAYQENRERVSEKVLSGQHYVEEQVKAYLPDSANEEKEPKSTEKDPSGTATQIKEAAIEKTALTEKKLASGQPLREGSEPEPRLEIIEPPELRSIDELKEELGLLEHKLKLDSAYIGDYVAKLYEITELYPSDVESQGALAKVAEEREKAIFDNAEGGKREVVAAMLQQHLDIFIGEPVSQRENRERKANSILRRSFLMNEARRQLTEKQVSVPEESNAVKTLHEVLNIEPNFPEAMTLLEDVSHAYTLEAQKAYRSGELVRAEVAIQRALNASPKQQDALKLEILIREAIALQEKLERHLAQAEAYSEHGFLYTPDGANAYDEFQAVLRMDSKNQDAQAGMAELMDKLSVLVWGYVGDARFEEASNLLIRPMSLMPEHERLLAMKAAIAEVEP